MDREVVEEAFLVVDVGDIHLAEVLTVEGTEVEVVDIPHIRFCTGGDIWKL